MIGYITNTTWMSFISLTGKVKHVVAGKNRQQVVFGIAFNWTYQQHLLSNLSLIGSHLKTSCWDGKTYSCFKFYFSQQIDKQELLLFISLLLDYILTSIDSRISNTSYHFQYLYYPGGNETGAKPNLITCITEIFLSAAAD